MALTAVADTTMTDPLATVKAERERRAAAKVAAMAAAEIEFNAWYQDVGTRAEKSTKGHAGANYGKVIATLPKCFCGKATRAFGLCWEHYSQFWDRRANKLTGRRWQKAHCHPDRAHHAYGFCRECYGKLPPIRSAARLSEIRRIVLEAPKFHARRHAWLCKHADRPHYGRGLCKSCWVMAHRKGILDQFAPPLAAVPKTPLCRHKDRPVHARGLCASCYATFRWRKNHVAVKHFRQRNGRCQDPGLPLKCGHNDRPHFAYDLCKQCFDAWRRQCKHAGRKIRVRSVYIVHEHKMPRTPICGHADRPHAAKGCCRSCYRKGFHKTPAFARLVLATKHPQLRESDVRPDSAMLDSVVA